MLREEILERVIDPKENKTSQMFKMRLKLISAVGDRNTVVGKWMIRFSPF